MRARNDSAASLFCAIRFRSRYYPIEVRANKRADANAHFPSQLPYFSRRNLTSVEIAVEEGEKSNRLEITKRCLG